MLKGPYAICSVVFENGRIEMINILLILKIKLY